ncbi:hypothetical protein OB905_08660 [Halobacteria archaeon AArc-dxtr1]|nr:hypothetical protein [Halobacteria archaeon AArc-dxtr1]
MNVRDALEADADAIAAIANSPTDVMRNLVHDRTVRIAEDGVRDPNADVSGSEPRYGGSQPEDILGFVSFDARGDTVHITQIGGTDQACQRLLAEPVRFAESEGMSVELLVSPDNEAVSTAVEQLGFRHCGSGPQFDGSQTEKFRLEP